MEDLAAEMLTAGMALDGHMLYTIFIDALPVECEVEARNLASRESIGCGDIIMAVRERHHPLSGSRKKGSNAGHAGHAMFAGGGDGGHKKRAGGGVHWKGVGRGKRKVGRRGRHGRGGKGTNEDGGGSAAAARSAAAPKPPMVVPPKRDATGMATRVIAGSTARRSYAGDATDGGTPLMSAPHPE